MHNLVMQDQILHIQSVMHIKSGQARPNYTYPISVMHIKSGHARPNYACPMNATRDLFMYDQITFMNAMHMCLPMALNRQINW